MIGSSSGLATLTASFNDNQQTLDTRLQEFVTLYIDYTPAEVSRNLTIQFETGWDKVNFFPASIVTASSAGTETIDQNLIKIAGGAGGTSIKRRIVIQMADEYSRFSVKEDGSSNFGTCSIVATYSGK